MADSKVSQLTAVTTALDGDFLYIVDSSTSPVTSKKITYANFEARVRDATIITDLGAVTAAAGDYLLVLDVSASPQVLKKVLVSDLLDNATHSGDAAGASVLTLQAAAISGKAEVTAIGTDYVLILDTSVSPHALKKALASDFAGSISASSISGQVTATAVGSDYFLILDVSDSPNALKKALVSDVLDNATHTGQVTGATALTVNRTAISDQSLVTVAAGDNLLILDVSASPNALAKIAASDFATAAQANATHTGHATGATALTLQPAAIIDQSLVTVAASDNLLILDASASPLALKKIAASDFATAAQANATHTGEVTGATALTVQPAAISNRSSATVAAGDQILILDVSDSPNALKRISASDFATAAQANATHTGDASGATALTLQASAISGRTEAVSVGTDYLLFLDVSDSPNALKKDAVQDVVDLAKPIESIIIAISDETTAVTTGTNKARFRMPYAFTLTEVYASANTAPVGSSLIIDINEKVGQPSPNVGTSILSIRLYIDTGEYSSRDASASPSHQAVISDTSLALDSEIQIDIDQVGASTAGAGIKIGLIGRRT